MIQVGVQTKGIIDGSKGCEYGFQMIREAGFERVDFNLDSYLKNTEVYAGKPNHFFDSDFSQIENIFQEYRRGMDLAGIQPSQMHAPYPVRVVGNPQVSQYMQSVVIPRSFEIGEILGVPWMVIHPFKLQYSHGIQREWEENLQFFKSLVPLCRQHGVRVCLENLYEGVGGRIVEGVCADPMIARNYIDALNDFAEEELFGICLDTGHIQLAKRDVCEYIRTLGNRIKIFHLHENDAIYDLHQMPYTFGGEEASGLDWDGFVKEVRAIDFQGTLSFETFPCMNSFPYEIRRDVLKNIYAIGRYFAEQIESK